MLGAGHEVKLVNVSKKIAGYMACEDATRLACSVLNLYRSTIITRRRLIKTRNS